MRFAGGSGREGDGTMADDQDDWLSVAPVDELDDPGSCGFTWQGWDHWGFVVRVGSRLAAYRNVCPHAGHPLHYAPHAFLTADGTQLICSSHGAVFERLDGRCVAGPCAGAALTPIPVRERDGMIEVAPDAAGAAPSEADP